jgi:phenylalanyl-tRNA synthetase beta chain
MRVPVSWLKEYVDVSLPIPELAERMTLAGLEVAAIERIGVPGAELVWHPELVRVAEVVEVKAHPNADRLVLAVVNYGEKEYETCVTGAPNMLPYVGKGRVSFKVAFAKEGAQLWDPYAEQPRIVTLKRSKIRGVPSAGMVCSERELGLSDEHEGNLILPDDAPVGVPLADYLGDVVLDLDLTPNLARCFSIVGVAREVAALTGQALRIPALEVTTDGAPAEKQVSIEILDPSLCPRYIGMVIRDVSIGSSPFWMQRRLHVAGMRPISNVVDVTNYVMLEWGQPLHAFDYDKLVQRAGGGPPTIIVRVAEPGERMTTLDEVERELTPDDLLICDTAGPVAIAGVMGGAETEVTEDTQSILLEAANFNLISIRRTSQRLKLPSEASARFGRGVHPAMAERGALRASQLLHRLTGASVAPGMADAYPVPARPVMVSVTPGEAERILGVSLTAVELADVLQSLEFDCTLEGDTVSATVPDHRLDVTCSADLLEEVARIYGYDRIPATLIADRLPPQRENRGLVLEERVRELLVAAGLQEVVTYRLTTPERERALLPPGTPPEEQPFVTLGNPISTERTVMRRSILASVLEAVAANLRFRDRVAFFEIGQVYLPTEEQNLPSEPLRLALVLTGPREALHWTESDREPLDLFDLKGIIETVVAGLHLSGVAYVPAVHPTFQPGRVAQIVAEEQPLGVFGQLHPLVADNFGLPSQPVLAASLDLGEVLSRVPESHSITPMSRYPAIRQDLAVVVGETVPASEVQLHIEQAGGRLLRRVQLFDVYRGEQIEAGKKSLAYTLTFQADDRTLTDHDANRLRDKIVRRLSQEVSATLRG